MSLILGVAALSFGLQAYGVYTNAKESKRAAELQKEDISLQREAAELAEEARLLEEEMAEAKVRSDVRKAQAIRLTQSAVTGTDFSSSNEAMRESLTTQVESGIALNEELSGIASKRASIQQSRFDVAASMIREPSDLDIILGYAGAGLSSGMLAMRSPEFKAWNQPTWTTDYNIPMTSTDFE